MNVSLPISHFLFLSFTHQGKGGGREETTAVSGVVRVLFCNVTLCHGSSYRCICLFPFLRVLASGQLHEHIDVSFFL